MKNIILFFVGLALVVIVGQANAVVWNTSFIHSSPIMKDKDLVNESLSFYMSEIPGWGRTQVLNNCNDVRIVDSTNTTMLDYYIDICNTTDVRIGFLSPAGTGTIGYVYWNYSAAEAQNKTMRLFYDDFNDNSLNYNNWNFTQGCGNVGVVHEEGGILNQTALVTGNCKLFWYSNSSVLNIGNTVISKVRWNATGQITYVGLSNDIQNTTAYTAIHLARKYDDNNWFQWEDDDVARGDPTLIYFITGQWYWFKVSASGSNHIGYVWNSSDQNDTSALSASYSVPSRNGYAGISLSTNSGGSQSYDDFQVWNNGYVPKIYTSSSSLSFQSHYITTNCSGLSNTKSVTLSFLNETSPFSSINGTANYYFFWTGGILSGSFTNNSKEFCVYPSTANFSVDGQFQYTGNVSGVYSNRDYYFENMVFDNVQKNLNLYLLPSSIGTRITIIVKDQYANTQEGVIVKILRWYPELNAYKIVAAPKTDSSGETNTYLVAYDVDYAFILEKDGVILDTKNRQKITSAEIILTISPAPILEYLKMYNMITGNVSYDEATGNITATYNDLSGYVTNVTFDVYKVGVLEHSLFCSKANTSLPSGIMVCHIGNVTSMAIEYQLIAHLKTGVGDTYIIYIDIMDLGYATSKLFGNCSDPLNAGACKEGLFIALLFVILCAFIGMASPAAAMLIMVVGLFVTMMTGLYTLSVPTIIGMVFVAFVIIWRIRQ